ncbi:hypothetical protein EJ04DRAFT_591742 [Polyplosphaeria fusca]|uniref:BTB domain-containing protein n=1 Tax=Polyplosphaeria fusca TaxID=682080 RepID=A0A9P4QP49_9PLEO|nr:hypothetical protein EJ04DRAFT_591742 [Polyplosphaeria fusca]
METRLVEDGLVTPSPQWMQQLFENGFLSDLQIQYGGTVFKVHSKVLNSKSSLFEAAFQNSPVNGITTISLSRINTTANCQKDVKAMALALRFCYTEEYTVFINDDKQESKYDEASIPIHVYIHHFATKFNITDLIPYAVQKYRDALSFCARVSNDDKIFSLIKTIYAFPALDPKTTQMIHESALQEFKRRLTNLEALGRHEKVLQRLKDNPKAAEDFFAAMHGPPNTKEQSRDLKRWICTKCTTTYSYEAETVSEDLTLTLCPCCRDARSFSPKKQGRILRNRTVVNHDEDEDE